MRRLHRALLVLGCLILATGCDPMPAATTLAATPATPKPAPPAATPAAIAQPAATAQPIATARPAAPPPVTAGKAAAVPPAGHAAPAQAKPAPKAGTAPAGSAHRSSSGGGAAGRGVRIPSAIRAGDKTVPAGTYEAKLARDGQGTWVELWKDGALAARELGVKPVRQPPRSGKSCWATMDVRQERMVRVFCQEGRELYLAAFEAMR